jgi:pimeloyl-ACP methyl ester carboxylesterase
VIDRYADRPWFRLSYVPRTLDPSEDWPDMDFDPAPIIAEVRCPVLLVYGESDEWTPIEPSVAAWERARDAEVTVIRLAGADHAPTLGGVHERDAISSEYTEVLTEWLDQRLAGP